MGKKQKGVGDIEEYISDKAELPTEDKKKKNRKMLWRILILIGVMAQIIGILVLESRT